MKIKTRKKNWLRHTLQWGIILFVLILAFAPKLTKITTPNVEAYCPFGGLLALGSYLSNQALSCSMTSAQIGMGIILFAGVLLFGKLFCSFICPIGTLSEWLGKLGDKLKIRFTISAVFDKILRSLKYILLFTTLFYTLQSNELFCKKFDPYYALASGFNTDVVVLYAIFAIVLVVLGSVFIRMFWCKYLCPLGAISTIFKFSLFFIVTIGVYLSLLKFGIRVSYLWPLAVASLGAYILEIWEPKRTIFPLTKITRNSTTCTHCKLCSDKCPQGIDVASLTQVKHADCNLCGDCLQICPVKNTLTINNRKELKYLPIIAVVICVTLGIILGKVWEIPTINLKWGEPNEIESAEIFTQSGLKNIKCYGSSMAFANKMKQIPGVYGLATYVKHHRVKIYYNSTILSNKKLQKLLFTPRKKTINTIAKGVKTIYGVRLKLENFFDTYDFNYLATMLRNETNAVELISTFDCPVSVEIYFASEIKNKKKILALIESKSYTIATTQGLRTIDLKYKIAGTPKFFTISHEKYIRSLFTPFEKTFNYRKSYSNDVLKTYALPIGNNATFRNRLRYLVSHLSNNDGIVEFKTELNSTFHELAKITYVDTMTNVAHIEKALLSDTLTIFHSNGSIKKVANMFNFTEEIQNKKNKKNNTLKGV